jgi:uncharacterized protein
MRKTTCPSCGHPPAADHAPFCSPGCRDRDLLRWFGEGYRIPGRPVDPTALDSAEERG